MSLCVHVTFMYMSACVCVSGGGVGGGIVGEQGFWDPLWDADESESGGVEDCHGGREDCWGNRVISDTNHPLV